MQLVLAAELEGDVDGAIFAAVVDYEDLVARNGLLLLNLGAFLCGFLKYLTMGLRRRAAGASALFVVIMGGTAEAFVKILDGLFERGYYSLLFVVGGYHDGDFDLGGLDMACVGGGERIVAGGGGLAQLALGEPAIVPARKWSGLTDAAAGFGRQVCLL